MTADVKPSTWLGAGYAADSSGHTITMNTASAASNKTLANLTDAQANPTTGTIEAIVLAFMEAMIAATVTQTAATNVPANMAITKSAYVDPVTGVNNITYNATIKCNPPALVPATEV